MAKSFQVFLSHSARDRKWCEWLKRSAASMGVRVYLAEHDLRPGQEFVKKIEQEIDASKAVVVLVSENSVNVPLVTNEVGYARKAKKLIIPLVQPGIPIGDLGMLQGLEYIPFDFNDPHEGRNQLNAALKKILDQQAAKERQREAMAVAGLVVIGLLLLSTESSAPSIS